MIARRTARRFTPVVTAVLAAAAAAAGCKGETTVKDSPATLAKISSLEGQMAQKSELIKNYEARIATLEAGGGGGQAELLITFVDDVLKVSPAGKGGRAPIDDAATAAMSRTFIDLVQKSRGAIQKCYEGALKKNASLQARTLTLKVSASFAAAGDFQKVSFTPALDAGFDSCMRGVAAKWKMPAGTHAVTFQAPVSLTPN